MRLLHLIAPGPIAGAEKVVLTGAAALQARGHETELAVIIERRAPDSGERFAAAAEADGLRIRRFESGGRFDASLILGLQAALRDRFDAVHVHGYKALVHACVAVPAGVPLFATHHGTTGHDLRARFYEALQSLAYRRLHTVFAVSAETARMLQASPVGPRRVCVVENMLALPDVDTSSERSRGAGALRLLYLGRLSVEKGPELLLQALAGLDAASRPSLDIAGEGPLRPELEARARQLGIEGSVKFLGFHPDVQELLSSHDAIVMPSLREGLPMTLIEATASGLPVVASRVGGIPDLVADNDNGRLVDPGSVEELQRALVEVSADYPRFARSAAHRAASIQDRYSRERWGEKTEQAYLRAASGGALGVG